MDDQRPAKLMNAKRHSQHGHTDEADVALHPVAIEEMIAAQIVLAVKQGDIHFRESLRCQERIDGVRMPAIGDELPKSGLLADGEVWHAICSCQSYTSANSNSNSSSRS